SALPGEDLPIARRGARVRQSPRPAARSLLLHERPGDRGAHPLRDDLRRRDDQQLHPPRRPARSALRRDRRERDGALPRLGRVPRVPLAPAGIQEAASVVAAVALPAVQALPPPDGRLPPPLQALTVDDGGADAAVSVGPKSLDGSSSEKF